MLVVLSDLHFVDGTGGDHTPPSNAFRSVLLNEVLPLARANRAREIQLVLLGDIFDLVRSEQWLERDGLPFPPSERPWGGAGIADVDVPRIGGPTERRCLDILGRMPADNRRESVPRNSILHRNWATLHLLRTFPTLARHHLGRDVPVEIVFVPGNHDRLVNVYPHVRDEVARILGLSAPPSWAVTGVRPGGWWFPFAHADEDYGIVARHGHQFDPWNYAGRDDLSHAAHLLPVVGDVFAAEFAVKLPWMLRAMRGRWSVVTEAVIDSLQAMHDVRPAGHVLEWLRHHIAHGAHAQLRSALDAAVSTTIKALFDVDLVRSWRGMDRRWEMVRQAMTRPGLCRVSKRAVDILPTDGLLPFILGRSEVADDRRDAFVRAASRELARWTPEPGFVVYGHTHVPGQHPLGGGSRREAFYINAGTWRQRIFRSPLGGRETSFARLNELTYAVFYRGDEDVDGKRPGTVSFEVRTATWRKEAAPVEHGVVIAACEA